MDKLIFEMPSYNKLPSEILTNLIPYAENHIVSGGRLWDICRHLLNLVKGINGAKNWRNELFIKANKQKYSLYALEDAIRQLKVVGY